MPPHHPRTPARTPAYPRTPAHVHTRAHAKPSRTSVLLLPTLALLTLLLPTPALGYDYGREILIDSEEDIYELYNLGDLSEAETEQLLAMLKRKLS